MYRRTFIQTWILVVIIVVVSALTFVTIKDHYCRTYNTKRLVYPFLQSMFSFGFLVTTLFMASNFYFQKEDLKAYEYSIQKVGELGGRNHKPYAIITHKGQTKELIFKRNPNLKLSDKIRLEIKTGILGFEVINKQTILK